MDYIVKFTDPNKQPFVVTQYGSNGPATPASPIPLDPKAVTANTSLILFGKGLSEYGDRMANNLLHILENFANSTEPAYKVEGQCWYDNINKVLKVYNGTSWDTLFHGTGYHTDLDMNGYRIINLADPIDPDDALNYGFAEARYMPLTGGTFNGNVTMGATYTFTLSGAPTIDLHAATKKYVDDAIAAVTGGSSNLYMPKTGGIFTGATTYDNVNIVLNAGASVLFTGYGTLDMHGNIIQNVGIPLASTDGANKQYVDNSIATSIGTLGTRVSVLESGTSPLATRQISGFVRVGGGLDVNGGVITSSKNIGITADTTVANNYNSAYVIANSLTPIVLTVPLGLTFVIGDYIDVRQENIGTVQFAFAAGSTVNTSDGILATRGQGSIVRLRYRATNVWDIIPLYTPSTQKTYRQIIIQTVTGTTTFTLNHSFVVGYNKLSVFLNGVKQIADQPATCVLPALVAVNYATPLPLVAASTSYSVKLTVDGVDTDLSITSGTGTYTVQQLLTDLKAAITTATLNVHVMLDFTTTAGLLFITDSTGTGSNVTIGSPTTGTDLLTVINDVFTVTPVVFSPTDSYAYKETGAYGSSSDEFVYNTAPPDGSVLEVLIN